MLVVEAVNAFGSGVAGLSVLCPPAHSTHVCHSSPSRTLPWSVHFHHDFVFGSSSRTGWGGGFGLRQTFSWLHELLSTHALKFHVLAVDCSSTDKNGAVSPHAGPPLLCNLTQRDSFPIFPLTHRNFWVFPRCSFPSEIVDAVAIERRYFFPFLCVVFMCFPHDFVAQDGLYSPRLL